jgi:hypothetical protein
MRVRTAVAITAGIITAQVAAAWFAEKAWLALPDRRWPPARWHIELGNLSEALAAFAGAGAALIALWIASRDRRERKAERRTEENTVARLVRLDVESSNGRPVVVVKVRNFGPLPILDVAANGGHLDHAPRRQAGDHPTGPGRARPSSVDLEAVEQRPQIRRDGRVRDPVRASEQRRNDGAEDREAGPRRRHRRVLAGGPRDGCGEDPIHDAQRNPVGDSHRRRGHRRNPARLWAALNLR